MSKVDFLSALIISRGNPVRAAHILERLQHSSQVTPSERRTIARSVGHYFDLPLTADFESVA